MLAAPQDARWPPRIFSSPDGAWSLGTIPTDTRRLVGPATEVMHRDGVPVWRAERDVTLHDARVADDGRVLAIAYTHGLVALGDSGSLVVLLLDAGGNELVHELSPVARSTSAASPTIPSSRAST